MVFFSPTESKILNQRVHVNLPWPVDKDVSESNGPLRLPYARPKIKDRKFISTIIENQIFYLTSKMKDQDLARLFENCFPNTLDTTVTTWRDNTTNLPRTFIVTGDIPAMWLRDSTNQVLPYIRFAKDDEKLKNMLLGLIYMQAESILRYPYANAFHPPAGSKIPRWDNPWSRVDHAKPPPHIDVWEAKWEIDSLAAFLKLSYRYFEETCDNSFVNDEIWQGAVRLLLDVIKTQQKGTMEEYKNEGYTFTRETRTSTETLMLNGRGAPVRRVGLVKSQFRPSDDATVFPFLIPANAMLSVELAHLKDILLTNSNVERQALAKEAIYLSSEIRDAIYRYGITHHIHFGPIFAYEVDGFGSVHLMDDANIPSLLSLPYLGFIEKEHELYQQTRKFVLSEWNKYWFSSDMAEGVGGPHIGLKYIWPMSLCMRILTAKSGPEGDQEILQTLEQLKRTTAEAGLMHESFLENDPQQYTRAWFAWANTLFGETILQLSHERPHLIFQ